MTIGVYMIKNTVNNKVYVGSTAESFKKRWRIHRWGLLNDHHPNNHLQNARNKYGEGNFKFIVLEELTNIDAIIEREQYWLDVYRSNGGVYNFGTCAETPALGYHHTNEAIQKIRITSLGRRHTDEARQKIRIALKGNTNALGHRHTDETRRKMSTTYKLYPAFIDPSGILYPAGINLRAFCRKHDLIYPSIHKVKQGTRKQYKGWRLA